MALVLFLLFLIVPVVELYVIIQVGQLLGVLPTLLLLVLVSVAGAALVKREGRGAWQRFRAALDEGRMPAEEVVDGALLLLGGALMLTPGFVTDVVGLLVAIPVSRAVINRGIRRRVRGAFGLDAPRNRGVRRGDDVVDVEVVRVERDPGPEPAAGSPSDADAERRRGRRRGGEHPGA